MNRSRLLPILLLVFCLRLTAESGYDPHLGSYLHSLDRAEPPGVISQHLVLTYYSRTPVRYVAAAFEHEDFTRLHIYEVNQNGVFVLAYPLPEGVDQLNYRIVVDGLWMRDPVNPAVSSDSRGIPISVARLPQRAPERGETPVIHPDGTVEFVYFGNPGSQVRLTGDFNHWSPFSHPLKEVSPGEYRLRLRLYRGFHRYAFFVNGELVSDALNPRIAYDTLGNQVSSVTVSGPTEKGTSIAGN